jgi:hypothetical protein
MKHNNLLVRRAASTTGLLLILLLLVAFTVCNYSSLKLSTRQYIDGTSARSSSTRASYASGGGGGAACDVARGEWVPDPAAPYYTNETCPLIDSRQDCMKYGKPGLESILRWRWRPHGCDLPRFDAAAFLRLVRDKSMAFVGDSVARNHMQSLMCLLSKVRAFVHSPPSTLHVTARVSVLDTSSPRRWSSRRRSRPRTASTARASTTTARTTSPCACSGRRSWCGGT